MLGGMQAVMSGLCPCRPVALSEHDPSTGGEGVSDRKLDIIVDAMASDEHYSRSEVLLLLGHLLRCRAWVDGDVAAALWGCPKDRSAEKLAGISRAVVSDNPILVPVRATVSTPDPAYALSYAVRTYLYHLVRHPIEALKDEQGLPGRPLLSELVLEWFNKRGSVSIREAAVVTTTSHDNKWVSRTLRQLAEDHGWVKAASGPNRRVRYFPPGADVDAPQVGYVSDKDNEDLILGIYQKPPPSNSEGICLLCGGSCSRLGSAQHIKHCRGRSVRETNWNRRSGHPEEVRSYHLQMWDPSDPDFWLHIEIAAHLTLETLDSFMRQTWMECCDHLSQFFINDRCYRRSVDNYLYEDRPMNISLDEVLGSTKKPFWYEYDFGSTSQVRMKVLSKGYSRWPGIRLLAHNTLSFYKCGLCEENATTIRHQWNNDGREQGKEVLCDTAKHPPAFLDKREYPIANSPRWGICGYTGGANGILDESLLYGGYVDLTPPTVDAGIATPAGADKDTEARVGSMLWAAYGDALAFMHERQMPQDRVAELGTWSRHVPRIGETEMPAGSGSDHTQLRMATARAIDGAGFNIDAFSRIELPMWASYAFTTDHSEKVAALNLAPRKSRWWANNSPQWTAASGPSPAMRIQPHAWAATKNWLVDVVVNTVTTHGSPTELIAACFHALCLAHCLREESPPTLEECQLIAGILLSIPRFVEDHSGLRKWKNQWEQRENRDLSSAWGEAALALSKQIDSIPPPTGNLETWYGSVIDALGIGWGSEIFTTHITVAASALASVAPDAHTGVMTAINLVNSPIKAIATLTGALLGAAYPTDPPQNPLDHEYLRGEAERLADLNRGEKARGCQYPSIDYWVSPKSQVAALSEHGGRLVVEGLGPVRPLGNPQLVPNQQHGAQWVRTDYGQTLFVKRRRKPREILNPNSEHPTR